MNPHPASSARALGVRFSLTVVAAILGCATWWSGQLLAATLTVRPAALEDILIADTVVTAVCVMFGFTVALLADVHRLAADLAADRPTPIGTGGTWRNRVAATLLGLTIWPTVAATGAPGAVTPTAAVAAEGIPASGAREGAPDPGWVPTLPGRPTEEIAFPGGHGEAAQPVTLVVRRGDCLWDLVELHLGPKASAVEVARAVPVWFALNRSTIGADPNLLLPGQILRIPATAGGTR